MDAISGNARSRRTRTLRSACRAPIEQLERRLFLTTANYAWSDVAIGCGGFVDGIFYDPHNANVMYARTDVSGLYKSVNDGQSWTELLHWTGGNGNGGSAGVLSFAIDPENSNNIYADTGFGNDGYVIYSTDAGATWGVTQLSIYVGGNDDGRGAGERIAVDPYDSNIIMLGSSANGLWESTDAGHSFSQVTSISTSASIDSVVFDPNGGTTGHPTQEIFVGENSTSSGTNLLETTNGGTSWTQVTGTGTVPTGWLVNRAVMASDGNLYVAYANDQAPTEPTNGAIMRYNTSTGVWANISPVVPQRSGAPYDDFGYCGLALDPNSSSTLVVTSLDRYNYGDMIWRTTNANSSSPSWTALFSSSSNNGTGGYNTTRNASNAPWAAGGGDGIGNWACAVAIDPFNSAQIMYGTGGGIWATNNGTATSALTAPNSWYFPDNGLEMTGAFSLAGSTGGTPLYSGLGDVGGFGHTTLTSSPEQGAFGGGSVSGVDYAGLVPNDMVAVTAAGVGLYSTNGGATVTSFATAPAGIVSADYSNATIAVSANDQTMVWAAPTDGPYYSGNNGASWTATNLIASVTSITQSGGVPTVVTSSANNFVAGQSITISGATPSAYNGTYTIASVVNSTTFTYTDANVTSSTTSPATGTITAGLNGTILSDKVNPNYFYYWCENATWNGFTLYISTNGGQTFSPSAGGTIGTGQVQVAVNATVAGQIWISTYNGLFESTNFGASFNHVGSWSNNFQALALGAPAPGSAYPSIYTWGTPAGDTFQGIYRSDDGGNTWLQVDDVNHQYSGYPLVMAADPIAFGRFYISSGGIIAGNPATSLPSGWTDTDINVPGNYGWATGSTTLSSGTTVNQWNVVGDGAGFSSSPISISSLSRTGGVATAVTTTACGLQIGQTITISGATNSVYDGTFVVTGLYDTVAGLNKDIGAATEFTFAIASGTDTASGTITATLRDQFNFASDAQTGNSSIIAQLNSLTDPADTAPAAGVMYRASANNPIDPFVALLQNASDQLVFEYRTTSGGSITSTTLSSVAIGSEYVELIRTGSTYSAFYGTDGIHWTQLGSAVTISAIGSTAYAGLAVTAGYNPQLASATFSHVAVDMPPTLVNAAAASATTVTAATVNLSALASDADGQSNLTYTWATTGTPPAAVTFTPDGTTAAQNTIATFTQPGNYSFMVTISNTAGQSVTSSVSVTVVSTFTTIAVTPASPTVSAASTTQLSAIAEDQFGTALTTQPNFIWSVTSGTGSVDETGLFTAPSAGGSATVQASTGTIAGTASITISPALGIFTNDLDIGSPTPAGSASYAASTGVYTVTGGGADIWNTSDQFNYLYKSYSGNGTLIARVTNIPNVPAAGGWSKAALMWRNSTSTSDVFVDVLVSYSNGISLQYRTASGGSATQSSNFSATAPAWIELVRNGSTFTGYYSTSTSMPTSWTLVGTVSASNMSTNALVGLAVTSHDQGTSTTDTLSNVQITGTSQAPAVAIAAATSAQTISVGGSANLSVLGVDEAGASGLTYTWAATPSSGVTFTANGSNAAANTTATFSSPGLYTLLVTIKNAGNLATTSTVNVNVLPAWLSATSIAQWNPTTTVLTVAGATTVDADPGSVEPIINASGSSAVLTLDPASGIDIHLGGLSLTDGARATVTSLGSARSSTNYHLLVIGTTTATAAPTFNIDSTSTLDLADNDLAILYGSGTSPLSQVEEDLQTGANYNGSTGIFQWNGTGLISSVAPSTNGATGLGYATESELSAISQAGGGSAITTFDGQSLGANAVLVKYTLMGDSTLSGTVSGTDYNAVLANYDTNGDWSQGNFHYGGAYSAGVFTNGQIAGQDYNIVLGNYDAALASLLSVGAVSPAVSTAVAPATTLVASSSSTHPVRLPSHSKGHNSTRERREARVFSPRAKNASAFLRK